MTGLVRGASRLRRYAWPLAIAVLLIGAVIGWLALGGRLQLAPAADLLAPDIRWAVVVERSNHQLPNPPPNPQVSHLAFVPGAGAPQPVLADLPENATSPRWSPDARHMSYFELESTGTYMAVSELYIVDTSGGAPRRVALPRDAENYERYAGPGVWSPSGNMLALSWNTHSCPGGPNCIPTSGIDVFDAGGRLVAEVPTPDSMQFLPQWSPDSTAVGWNSHACEENYCYAEAFHTSRIQGDAPFTSVHLPPWSDVSWSTGNRLLVTVWTEQFEGIERLFTMALDGSDRRDVRWEADDMNRNLYVVWSPDGSAVAITDPDAGRVMIRDVVTGLDIAVVVPRNVMARSWSPDGKRLILASEEAYVINADGSGLLELGDALDADLSWMPVVDR